MVHQRTLLSPWTSEKHPTSTPALLTSLRHLRDTNPKAVRANIHIYPASIYCNDDEDANASGSRDRRITSWKMTEHMYFNANNPFPTLARGLFTEEVEDGDDIPPGVSGSGQGRDRIVARGYDKFFNIDEVEWTSWSLMRHHTEPPYHLTLKSNGCLILIAALTPWHLVVTSKHSLGTTTEAHQAEMVVTTGHALVEGIRSLAIENGGIGEEVKKGKGKARASPEADDADGEQEAQAHAEVGRRWLTRTLRAKGRTEVDLAQRLWDSNSTAVLELCDDSFEEHVIATPTHWTGLHLHGLNYNTPHFSTASPLEVRAFAEDFGFIVTKFVELQTLDEVKAFTDEVARSGSWEGDQIEGFVVRSTVRDVKGKAVEGKPPYRPGAPFFFKVKFDEPYMLYRQWRETTRALLPLLDSKTPVDEEAVWKKVRSRIKRPEVGIYADWCGRMIKEEPKLFEGYERGVVRVRDRFLAWTEREGAKAWTEAKAGNYKVGEIDAIKHEKEKERAGLPRKWMIVPVAVPGCGKTLIGLALSHLFGFGHTQSDDVVAKRTAPTFLKNIAALMQEKDFVYADRNNHIDKHYNELSDLTSDRSLKAFDLRLIGVVWDVDAQPYHRLLRICSERVVTRGDNHQTLRPDSTVEAEHEAIVGQFLRNWTAPEPALFDKVISVNIADAPQEALGKVVNGLVDILGLTRPTEKAIFEALEAATQYKVTTPYHAPAMIGKPVRYFGLAPEIDLQVITQTILSNMPPSDSESVTALFADIRSKNRIVAKPHVTLAHEKNVQEERESADDGAEPGPYEEAWKTCKNLASADSSPLYDFDITHLVWDERVMALALSKLRQRDDAPELRLPDEVGRDLHVTIGTRTEGISAYESRGIIKAAKAKMVESQAIGEAEEVAESGGKVRWVRIEGLQGVGRIRGMH